MPVLSALFTFLAGSFRTRAALQIEILALRHQLNVLQRSVKRPRLGATDRWLWVWLSRRWPQWRRALVIVKADTVIGWQRKGFRLFWTWKSRHGQCGRPSVAKDIRQLIRRMSRENPLWGAPKIHGELLKLGINISELTVKSYLGATQRIAFAKLENVSGEPRERYGFCGTSSRFRRSGFRFCTSSSFWPTNAIALCTSQSRSIRRRSGLHNNYAKLFRGTLQRVFFYVIAIASLDKSSWNRRRPWA